VIDCAAETGNPPHLPKAVAPCASRFTYFAASPKMALSWPKRDPLDRALSDLEAVVLLQLDLAKGAKGFTGGGPPFDDALPEVATPAPPAR